MITIKKPIRVSVALLIIILSIFIIIPRENKVEDNPMRTRPLLIAHGGGNKEFPDNTLEAFYNAYSVDPNFMIETDVSITKDGVIILSHDITLDRKTNLKNAYIHEVNYSDLVEGEVDFGYENIVNKEGIRETDTLVRYTNYLGNHVTPLDVLYPEGVLPRHNSKFLVTTLEELIISFPNNLINVEIKQSGEIGLKALDAVIKLLDDLDEEYNTYSRIILASFHKEIYQEFKKLKAKTHPELLFSPEQNGVIKFFLMQQFGLDLFFTDKIAVFQLPSIFLVNNKGFIYAAHRHNIAVHFWTIDDEEEMRFLINQGADGIMTNRPTLLKKVYDELNIGS
ncbi:MAG TPA: hypothetical protein GXZ48_01730 [Acholeplasmataceae bacterium]|jgi:glycerophosphoryl diester phosphodiesterase|nr:hypothetical protein [Acholeplasmataceae bacterium]